MGVRGTLLLISSAATEIQKGVGSEKNQKEPEDGTGGNAGLITKGEKYTREGWCVAIRET